MLFWNQTLRLFILKSLGKYPAYVHPLVITAVSETWAQSLGGVGVGGGRGGNPHPQLPVLREFQADVGREARGCRRTRSLWNTGTGQGGGAMAQLKWDATPKTTGGAGEKAQWVKSGRTNLWTRF